MSRIMYVWQTAPDSLLRAIAWILLGLTVVLVLIRYMRATRTSARACPRCGYNLTALRGETCTECGAALRRTGVVPPGRWPMSLLLRIAIWTLVLLCVTTVAYPRLEQHIRRGALISSR